jgi:thymidylate synthase ThyX
MLIRGRDVSNKYISKDSNGNLQPTQEGRAFLESVVTNIDSNIYSFKPSISSKTVAAAMARLSRNSNDMRTIILSEFAGQDDKDEALLRRVITAFGDDSVQQLVGQYVVVEGASNLLTKLIEWGRLAAYLEQSTRYIYFDQKDKSGKYGYFTPNNLDFKTDEKYHSTMDKVFDTYSNMVRQLTDFIVKSSNTPEVERDAAWRAAVRAQACDAVRPALPVATKSTVGIFGSGQALENMIMRLKASESAEARNVANQILEELRKVIPTFLERADKPERGGATTAYLAETNLAVEAMARKNLSAEESEQLTQPVNLYNVTPQNEMDILPDMLFDHSNRSRDEIVSNLERMSDDVKKQIFDSYFGKRLNRRHRPGRALENVHYSFELISDYGIFRDLQRHRIVDDLGWQRLSTAFGYDTPKIIRDGGLEEDYDKCFQLSGKLYNRMKSEGYDYEAQYATLLGHKMRWKLTVNAREAFHLLELRTSPQGHPGYRKLCKQMYDEIAQVHPVIASHMTFINQSEDPELTRLAAERATAYKLKTLDEAKEQTQ